VAREGRLKHDRAPSLGGRRPVAWKKVEGTPTMGSELVFKTRVAFQRQQFDSATFRLSEGQVGEW
jgi:hypothetical protein